jgi:F0F1-type ATP synthase assembly protein I
MDTFDGSKPDLISNKILKDIESKLDTPGIEEGNKVLNGLGAFYENYILPNMFPLIVIMLLILYLTIKYVLKKDREENEADTETEKEDYDEDDEMYKKIIMNKRNNIKKEIIARNLRKPIPPISDMISDDYLITDEDEDDNVNNENDNNIAEQDNNVMDMLENRDTSINMDKAASLVFGK